MKSTMMVADAMMVAVLPAAAVLPAEADAAAAEAAAAAAAAEGAVVAVAAAVVVVAAAAAAVDASTAAHARANAHGHVHTHCTCRSESVPGCMVAQHFYRRKRRRVHVMRKWRGKTMVEEEKMSLVWKKVEVLKILRFFATFFRRREPPLLVILISLEWGPLTVLMRVYRPRETKEAKDETRQKNEYVSYPFCQNRVP